MHAARIDSLGKAYRRGWRDGAGISDDHPFTEGLFDAVVGKHHALDRGGIGYADPHNVGIFGRIGRRNCGAGSVNVLAAVRFQTATSCPASTRLWPSAVP